VDPAAGGARLVLCGAAFGPHLLGAVAAFGGDVRVVFDGAGDAPGILGFERLVAVVGELGFEPADAFDGGEGDADVAGAVDEAADGLGVLALAHLAGRLLVDAGGVELDGGERVELHVVREEVPP
jgi:hypothetical protein